MLQPYETRLCSLRVRCVYVCLITTAESYKECSLSQHAMQLRIAMAPYVQECYCIAHYLVDSGDGLLVERTVMVCLSELGNQMLNFEGEVWHLDYV